MESSAASSSRARPSCSGRWQLVAWLLTCCSSTQFNGHSFRNAELAFQLGRHPESWHQVDTEGVLVAYRDDDSAATIAVNGRCGKDADDVPLEALTQHLFLEFTDRKLLDQQHLTLDARAALRTEMVADLDGVPKHYVVYVLKKNGCVYDFMHIASLNSSDEQRAAFDRFVRGFHTEH